MKRDKQLGIFAFILILIFAGCGNSDRAEGLDYSAITQEKMTCPDGAIAEVDPWGKNGLSRACKMKHGKFIGWENGQKIYEAYYEFGKLVGKAVWFDETGKVIKEVDYGGVRNKRAYP